MFDRLLSSDSDPHSRSSTFSARADTKIKRKGSKSRREITTNKFQVVYKAKI